MKLDMRGAGQLHIQKARTLAKERASSAANERVRIAAGRYGVSLQELADYEMVPLDYLTRRLQQEYPPACQKHLIREIKEISRAKSQKEERGG